MILTLVCIFNKEKEEYGTVLTFKVHELGVIAKKRRHKNADLILMTQLADNASAERAGFVGPCAQAQEFVYHGATCLLC